MHYYERGDYQLDRERDQLEQQAFRLQAYLRALRGKLEKEKASLASLRHETRTLLEQRNSSHLPDCPVARRGLLALQDLYQAPPQPCREQVYRESYLPDRSVYDDGGDAAFEGSQYGADVISQRGVILQKLAELDKLCKQEMMRINEVGTKLEPFKQLANDWTYQAELSKKYPKIDNAPKEKVPTEDKILMNKENTVILNCIKDIENAASEEPSGHPLIDQEYVYEDNLVEEKASVIAENPKDSPPIEVESRERETNATEGVEEPSGGGEEVQREEVDDSREGRRCEVAPISWGRLLVDKKKRKLEARRWTDCSSGSSTSSSSHCVEPLGEGSFLHKYMYSDSDYVYSPLFVSESEDTD